MTRSMAVKSKTTYIEPQSHEITQRRILKKILEQGLQENNLELSRIDQGEEVLFTLKKLILADLTDEELFIVAQTFKDIDSPINIGGKQEKFMFQSKEWEQYLQNKDIQQRESDYTCLQSRVMDRIAQYLYGAPSYSELLYTQA